MTRKKPGVYLSLTPEGVTLRIEAYLTGTDADLKADDAATWYMDLWERVAVTARLHAEYGIHSEGAPLPSGRVIEAEPAPLSVLPALPEPEEESSTPSLLSSAVPARQRMPAHYHYRTIQQFIQSRGRVSTNEVSQLIGRTASRTRRILDDMVAAGMLTREEVAAAGCGAKGMAVFYRVASGKEPEAAPQIQNSLAEVIQFSQGKRFLMLGGVPKHHTIKSMEAALRLAELRWPEFDEDDPAELRVREIWKPDVDLVVINRFHKKYSKRYIHEIQDAGKPFVVLPKGYSIQTLVTKIRSDVLPRLTAGAPPVA